MKKRKDVIVRPKTLELSIQQGKTISIDIPDTTTPAIIGDYILQEIKEKYPTVFISSDTANAISMVAMDGEKERMRLDEVSLDLGANWLPIKLSFKWKKK